MNRNFNLLAFLLNAFRGRSAASAHENALQADRADLVMGRLRRAGAVMALIIVTGLASPSIADAQRTPSTLPSHPAVAHPGLDQLNRECISLYKDLQPSIYHVQMPTPRWMAEAARDDARWEKYKTLNPDVRRVLVQQQLRNTTNQLGNGIANFAVSNSTSQPASNFGYNDNSGNFLAAPDSRSQAAQLPTTRPATQPAASEPAAVALKTGETRANSGATPGLTIIVPAQAPAVADTQSQAAEPINNRMAVGKQPGAFAPNIVGLLLDDKGHILVPMFIEREAVADQTIKLTGADGEVIEAQFVGSDSPTQLTVLKLGGKPAETPPAGATRPAAEQKVTPAEPLTHVPILSKPVQLSADKLQEGGLAVLISPADGSGRLSVWSGGGKEFGIVVNLDGQIAGIARYGQFLSGSACRLIVSQIIRYGAVKRATLGVLITQVNGNDPVRQQLTILGDRPAVRIDEVIKGSVAEKAGMLQGDLILAVDGEAIHDMPGMSAAIAARNGAMQVKVLREGKIKFIGLELVLQ